VTSVYSPFRTSKKLDSWTTPVALAFLDREDVKLEILDIDAHAVKGEAP